jgi:hypothetical protein
MVWLWTSVCDLKILSKQYWKFKATFRYVQIEVDCMFINLYWWYEYCLYFLLLQTVHMSFIVLTHIVHFLSYAFALLIWKYMNHLQTVKEWGCFFFYCFGHSGHPWINLKCNWIIYCGLKHTRKVLLSRIVYRQLEWVLRGQVRSIILSN